MTLLPGNSIEKRGTRAFRIDVSPTITGKSKWRLCFHSAFIGAFELFHVFFVRRSSLEQTKIIYRKSAL